MSIALNHPKFLIDTNILAIEPEKPDEATVSLIDTQPRHFEEDTPTCRVGGQSTEIRNSVQSQEDIEDSNERFNEVRDRPSPLRISIRNSVESLEDVTEDTIECPKEKEQDRVPLKISIGLNR